MNFFDVVAHAECPGDGLAVFNGSSHAGFFGQFDCRAGRKPDAFSDIAIKPASNVFDPSELFTNFCFRIIVSCLINVVRRVDREEREPNSCCDINVFRGFEMVGISTDFSGPAGSFRSVQRVVHNLSRCPLSSRHFANGLLWINRFDATTGTIHRFHVTGSC